jgi:hypothetical protein
MSDWDNDLRRAKEAIKRRDYDTARTILEMMPDNYIARDWLAKINRKNLKFRHDAPSVFIQNNVGYQPGGPTVPKIPLIIIILNMLFWAFLIVSTVAMNAVTAQYQAVTILGLFVGFGFLLLLYYLYWRFYWWMLALSWLLLTCGFFAALSAGMQLAF